VCRGALPGQRYNEITIVEVQRNERFHFLNCRKMKLASTHTSTSTGARCTIHPDDAIFTIDDSIKIPNVVKIPPNDALDASRIPIRKIVSEAKALYRWAMEDRDALVKAGLPQKTIDQLQPASGALRYTEGELIMRE
jgi:hypothetical protein